MIGSRSLKFSAVGASEASVSAGRADGVGGVRRVIQAEGRPADGPVAQRGKAHPRAGGGGEASRAPAARCPAGGTVPAPCSNGRCRSGKCRARGRQWPGRRLSRSRGRCRCAAAFVGAGRTRGQRIAQGGVDIHRQRILRLAGGGHPADVMRDGPGVEIFVGVGAEHLRPVSPGGRARPHRLQQFRRHRPGEQFFCFRREIPSATSSLEPVKLPEIKE